MSIPRGAGDGDRSQGMETTLGGEELVRLGYLLSLRPLRPKGGVSWIPEIHCHPSHTRSVGNSDHSVVLGGSYPVEDWCCWSIAFFLDDGGIGCFWLRYIPLASLLVGYPGQFACCEGTVRWKLGFGGVSAVYTVKVSCHRDHNYTRLVSGGAIWPRLPGALLVNPLSGDMDEVSWSLPRMDNEWGSLAASSRSTKTQRWATKALSSHCPWT